MQISEKNKGIVFLILSSFCFTMMAVCVRMSGDLPVIEKSFFRNLVAFLIAFSALKRDKIEFHPNRQQLKAITLRSIFGTIGVWGNFCAITFIPVSDAMMLNKLSPFFVVFFSWLLLKEKIQPVQILCLIGAMIGMLFILRPGFGGMFNIPALFGAVGGTCAGAAYTQVRKCGILKVPGTFVVFFFSAFSTLAAVPVMLFDFEMPTVKQILILLLAGVFASGGQFTVTAAYFHAPGREISIFDYTALLFSAISGYIFFHEIADGFSFIGYGIIVVMAVLMFLYNNGKIGKQRE